jgi:hypothetical protein
MPHAFARRFARIAHPDHQGRDYFLKSNASRCALCFLRSNDRHGALNHGQFHPKPIPVGPGRWHWRQVGELLDPKQLSSERLEALRSQDPESYAVQYQQSPIPPGGFIIKKDQIQYCDELPRRSSSSVYLQS